MPHATRDEVSEVSERKGGHGARPRPRRRSWPKARRRSERSRLCTTSCTPSRSPGCYRCRCKSTGCRSGRQSTFCLAPWMSPCSRMVAMSFPGSSHVVSVASLPLGHAAGAHRPAQRMFRFGIMNLLLRLGGRRLLELFGFQLRSLLEAVKRFLEFALHQVERLALQAVELRVTNLRMRTVTDANEDSHRCEGGQSQMRMRTVTDANEDSHRCAWPFYTATAMRPKVAEGAAAAAEGTIA